MSYELDPAIVAPVVGRYASSEGIRRIIGTINLRVWSNLENPDTDFDYTTIQADIDAADAYTDLRASRGKFFQYAGPFPPTVAFFEQIQRAADYQAAAYLVEHRNGPLANAQDEDYFRAVNGLFKQAERIYAMLFDSTRPLDGVPVTPAGDEPGAITEVELDRGTCIPEHWRP